MDAWNVTLRRLGLVCALAFAGPALAQDGGEVPAAPLEPTSEPTAEPEAPADAPASPEAAPEEAPASEEPQSPASALEPPPPPRITVDLPPPPSLADDLPIPTLTLDRIPPSTSFEFAIQVSYGTVAYFRDQVPPWVGFGFRGGWGKNFGLNRIGVAGTVTAEGDIGVHTQLALEPTFAWDYVGRNGLLLGAGVGPALVYTSHTATVETTAAADIAPSAAVRIGWSQTWSRVGRRLFVFAEPKVRLAEGRLSPVVAVAVGSGAGR
ncbi:MAG: hypothetical protein R3F59_02410 [Myxococcota bacterium]